MRSEFMSLKRTAVAAGIAAAVLAIAPAAQAGYIEVYGSPTYDPDTARGFYTSVMSAAPGSCVNNTGTAVGYSWKWANHYPLGHRGVRWYGDGTTATALGDLGTDGIGATYITAVAVNDANTAVGYAAKYVDGGKRGYRAVRWDSGGTAATELGHLGTDPAGHTNASATAVNDANTAVGYARRYVEGSYGGLGTRAVRWDGGGTAATELGHLGTDNGETYARANAVNNANTAVGYAHIYGDGNYLGRRAVRWGGGGTAATELDHLGTKANGETYARAVAVNDVNTAVGSAEKFVDGVYLGPRAVRWESGGTAATELDHLGTYPSGDTYARALAVNDANTAVGYAYKNVDGIHLGHRAVRWDGGGTAATELGHLGTDAAGHTKAHAYAVSDANTAVGYAWTFVDGSYAGDHAVMWGPDGGAVDLNTLIDPDVEWTLTQAKAISENGLWIAGVGMFDPDGAGPWVPYERLWVMQIPEPGAVTLLALGALALIRRRRHS